MFILLILVTRAWSLQVSMETKMATVDKAEELIEELCNVCHSSAIQGNWLLFYFPFSSYLGIHIFPS
jgi:hypothetical protein